MVARMMKWRPWPPAPAGRKVDVRLVVRRVEGVEGMGQKVAVEVRWKGGRMGLGALRRRVKRNWTREEGVAGDGGVVVWDEEFRSVCSLTAHKENAFQPWEIGFTVFSGLNRGRKKISVIGTASLNLAEFVSAADVETEINLPLLLPDTSPESHPTLNLTLSLLELRTFQELEVMQRCVMPVTSSPPLGDSLTLEKDERSGLKAGLRKVKILSDFISTRKAKKTCRDDEGSEGKCSTRSEDGEYAYPFDSDSLDDDDVDEVEEGDSSVRKSFSYGTLASANFYGGPVYSDLSMKVDYEDWIHYSHHRPDVGLSNLDHATKPNSDQPLRQTSKRSILNWKKRKLSFRSPKAKGEPLLKKGNGDEGGDDIDFDRRLLTSSDESYNGFKADDNGSGQRSSFSEFGEDNFVVGSWESKKFESRDGQMELFTQVFFASIDQRSERAAGESACTALVAVIADWFQSNADMMPIKSQFDSLIREGSLEWRNLCENQTYRELFPDKHFDLETVLQAKIRPLSVNPEKSFIGFFRPEGTTDNNSGFDFLHGAMSFDSIWDEISQAGNDYSVNGGPQLYIVSWNDHFFVLKVERDAYYIIDTLGERLYEGCNQAYILKFDENTLIYKTHEEKPASSEAGRAENQRATQENNTSGSVREDSTNKGVVDEEIVFRGKEACKEYIKSFLAAIPIRELQADVNKGLRASTPLHHRLQIEFHYTEASKQIVPVTPVSIEPTIMSSCRPEPEAAVTFAQSANLEVQVV